MYPLRVYLLVRLIENPEKWLNHTWVKLCKLVLLFNGLSINFDRPSNIDPYTIVQSNGAEQSIAYHHF